MQNQQLLLAEPRIFDWFDLDEMAQANLNIAAGLVTYRPLQLLFILDKMNRIGKESK